MMSIAKKIAPLILLLITVITPTGNAHSYMVASNPKNGSTVTTLPATVALTFNENLLVVKGKKPNAISITHRTEVPIRQGVVSVTKNVLTVPIASSQKIHGKITVTYRVVSADGHPVNGSFFFTVK
jgi:methionine-rich copper-binding protein CopC